MKELTKEQLEIVKREHPEWFDEVEVGKWYNLDFGKCLMFVTELISHKEAIGYGFDYTGEWREDGTRWGIEEAIEATTKEVKSMLIAEAKRRYKYIKNIGSDLTEEGDMVAEYSFSEFHYEKRENRLYSAPYGRGGLVVFDCGQWAPVIPQEKPSLQDDIQALKDRWPDINFTVIAEEKK